jgi:hypothetical protein
MISLRTEKTSRVVLYKMGERVEVIVNLDWIPRHRGYCNGKCENICTQRIEQSIVKRFKPLNTLPDYADYERNPGVWVIESSENSLYLIIYSDQHRKNTYKGTQVCIGAAGGFYNLTREEVMKFLSEVDMFLCDIESSI